MDDDGWRRSTFCASGECLEVRGFRKSTHSVATACVEAGQHDRGIVVRDSADPSGPVLAFSSDEWAAFTRRLRAGA
ncbi:MAG TPA: DUF397 domain-containing protein [Streptosporangiaceae bacterium]|nr:DUF397 domain-containing protein [Streptosporangiaceae bacterium]